MKNNDVSTKECNMSIKDTNLFVEASYLSLDYSILFEKDQSYVCQGK